MQESLSPLRELAAKSAEGSGGPRDFRKAAHNVRTQAVPKMRHLLDLHPGLNKRKLAWATVGVSSKEKARTV